jgi:hypothetical protein
VNWAKSEALAVGGWAAGLSQLPEGLTWKRGGFRYLGVHLGDEKTEKKNWEGVLEKWRGSWQSGGGCFPTCHTEEESS